MPQGLVFHFSDLVTVNEILPSVFHYEPVSLTDLLRTGGKAWHFKVLRTGLSNAKHTAKTIICFGLKMPRKGKPSSAQ